MSIEDRKQMSRRYLELWASDNQVKPEEILAADYVNHQEPDVEGGVSARGLESWADLIAGYHRAFSHSKVRTLMQIAEGDLVATRWEFTATHTGDYLGLAATKREVTWTGVQIDRFADGKIAESWVDWDKYRLFQGLGLVG